MKPSLVIALVSTVAAAVGFAAYWQLALDEPAPSETASFVAAANAAMAQQPTLAVPDIALKNRAGEMQSLRSWPNQSLIVNFWATWCAPCRKEIPLLKEIAKNEAKNGFQVVGIAIDFRDDVLKFADEVKLDYPLLIGEEDGLKAADAFGVASAGLPFTVFADNKSRVVATLMGELTKPKADIILAHVKRVNRGELDPDAARAAIQMKLAELPPAKH